MNNNPLTEIIPARARKYLYAVAFLIGTGITAWQASDGNWLVFLATLVPTLTSLLAVANTDVETEDEDSLDGHGTYADEVKPPEDL